MLRLVVRFLVISLFAIGLSGAVFAQTAPTESEVTLENAPKLFATWEQQAQQVETALQEDSITGARASSLRDLIDPHRARARSITDQAKAALAPLEEQLNALGPAPAEGESEDATIAENRAELRKRIEELKGVASKADLAFIRADRLIASVVDAQRQRFTDRLLTRGPTPLDPRSWVEASLSLVGLGQTLLTESFDPTSMQKRAQMWQSSGWTALALALFGLVLLIAVRRWALARLNGAMVPHSRIGPEGAVIPVPPSRLRRLLVGVGLTATRIAMPIIGLAAIRYSLSLLDLLGPTGEILADRALVGVVIMATAYALAYAFFAPTMPALRLSSFDDEQASRASFLSLLVASALALNHAVTGAGEALNMPISVLSVLNFCVLLYGSFCLWGLARLLRVQPESVAGAEAVEDAPHAAPEADDWFYSQLLTLARRGGYLVSIASPLLAISGFFALSRFLFENSILTGAVISICVVLFLVAQEAAQALSEIAMERKSKGGAKEPEPGEARLGLLPVFIGFLLALAALPVIALIWGATPSDLEEVYFGLTEGVTVGDTRFRPGDLLIAALVLGFGLFLTRLLQAVLRKVVMPRTRLDVGARSSIVSGLGYLGFFISALLAISAGGLDLTNLAFLGAALGVGIGFGLQNIVNNFVSGIILLVERPIKVGDWIEVAGTHGTVSKINVRSTEITTFDKASYIVPNSEFISGAVTNYTHGDLMGRVICPIGVGYGTDTRKVEKILLEIARAHPMVLRRPAPFVLFQAFGASSLDFELRAYLRDVNWVTTVRSDINFEVYRRFNEEGIEIPFAQTDVTIRGLETSVERLASSMSPRAPSRMIGEGSQDGEA